MLYHWHWTLRPPGIRNKEFDPVFDITLCCRTYSCRTNRLLRQVEFRDVRLDHSSVVVEPQVAVWLILLWHTEVDRLFENINPSKSDDHIEYPSDSVST